MSSPSRLPGADDVLKALFTYCVQKVPELTLGVDTLLKVIESRRYVLMENVLEHIYESLTPQPFRSGEAFNVPVSPSRFNINHIFLAHWLRSARGCVVTTNLDPLIEHAWKDENPSSAALHVVARPQTFYKWNELVQKPNVLWKLHGSADDSLSWAVTLPKVGFKLSDARADFIKHIVTEHQLCFVGYRAADLDLFPPILEAHQVPRSSRIYWIFYYEDGYKNPRLGQRILSDYLERDPNVRKLFEANPGHIRSIITTAERLFLWLESQCYGRVTMPALEMTVAPYDYATGIRSDIDAMTDTQIRKLVGFTLRAVGEREAALKVLDIDDLKIGSTTAEKEQRAQLLQEGAHTSFQTGKVRQALDKVDEARKLLQSSDDKLARAWCEFGAVTMRLDAKKEVNPIERVLALGRLFPLRIRFLQLSDTVPSNVATSALLGNGLSLFYQVKFFERLFDIVRLTRLRFVRRLLIDQYGQVALNLRQTEFLNTMPDVTRRIAFLIVKDNPDRAVDEMIESIRIAQVVSDGHRRLACERGQLLANQIQDAELKMRLLSYAQDEQKPPDDPAKNDEESEKRH